MVYFIWIIIGCLAFAFKKNKYVTALVFGFILIIYCFNTDNPDMQNYSLQYAGLRFFASEPLFNLIGNVFYKAGASYDLFKGALSIVAVALITWVFYRLTPYPTLALFMYSIYPLTLDVIQIRYTIAYVIVFGGIVYLIKYQNNHKKKDAIIFFSSVLIATGFHYGAILFAILGLLVLDIRKHRLIYLIIIPVALITGISLLDRFVPVISNIIGLKKAELWILSEKNSSILRTGRILVNRGLPIVFSVFLAYISKNYNFTYIMGGKTASIGLMDSESEKLYKTNLDPNNYYNMRVNRCLFICMFYIWLYSLLEITIAGDYERLARLGVLISVVLITRQLFYLEKHSRRITIILFLMMYVAYFILIMFFLRNKHGEMYISYVFRQVMENNSIFGITYP